MRIILQIFIFMLLAFQATLLFAADYKSPSAIRDEATNKQVSDWNAEQSQRREERAMESREYNRAQDNAMRERVNRSTRDLYIHSR